MASVPFKATDHFRGSWNAALGEQPLNAEVGYDTPQDLNLPPPGILAKAASTSNPFDSPMAELTETCANHDVKVKQDFKKMLERSLSSRAAPAEGNPKPAPKPISFRKNVTASGAPPLGPDGKPDMKAILAGVVASQPTEQTGKKEEKEEKEVLQQERKMEQVSGVNDAVDSAAEKVDDGMVRAGQSVEVVNGGLGQDEGVLRAGDSVAEERKESTTEAAVKDDDAFQAFFDEQVEAVGTKKKEEEKAGFDMFAAEFEKNVDDDFCFDPRAEESLSATVKEEKEFTDFDPFGGKEEEEVQPKDNSASQGVKTSVEEMKALDLAANVEMDPHNNKEVSDAASEDGSFMGEEEREEDEAEEEDAGEVETAAFLCPKTFATEGDLKSFLMSNIQSKDYMKCTLVYDFRGRVWNFQTKKEGKILMQGFLRKDGFKALSTIRQWAISMSSVQDFNKQAGKNKSLKRSTAKRDNALYLAKLKSNATTSVFDLYDTGKLTSRTLISTALLNFAMYRNLSGSRQRGYHACPQGALVSKV